MDSKEFMTFVVVDKDSPMTKLVAQIAKTRKPAWFPAAMAFSGLAIASVLTVIFLGASRTNVVSLRYLLLLVPFCILGLAGLLVYHHQAKQSCSALKDALDLMLDLQRESLKMDKPINWEDLDMGIKELLKLCPPPCEPKEEK